MARSMAGAGVGRDGGGGKYIQVFKQGGGTEVEESNRNPEGATTLW